MRTHARCARLADGRPRTVFKTFRTLSVFQGVAAVGLVAGGARTHLNVLLKCEVWYLASIINRKAAPFGTAFCKCVLGRRSNFQPQTMVIHGLLTSKNNPLPAALASHWVPSLRHLDRPDGCGYLSGEGKSFQARRYWPWTPMRADDSLLVLVGITTEIGRCFVLRACIRAAAARRAFPYNRAL